VDDVHGASAGGGPIEGPDVAIPGPEARAGRARRRRPPDELFVELRARGLTFKTIAAQLDCSERTARRACARPEMRLRIAERRAEVAGEAAGRLGVAVNTAIDQLVAALESEHETARLRAAVLVLNQFSRLREQLDLGAELASLRDDLKVLRARLGLDT